MHELMLKCCSCPLKVCSEKVVACAGTMLVGHCLCCSSSGLCHSRLAPYWPTLFHIPEDTSILSLSKLEIGEQATAPAPSTLSEPPACRRADVCMMSSQKGEHSIMTRQCMQACSCLMLWRPGLHCQASLLKVHDETFTTRETPLTLHILVFITAVTLRLFG